MHIAIGDNLLKRPFLSKLMKLNKSFIVKRSVQGRDKLAASKQLSGYISHCIGHGQNVWIAQREGRAKDGIDATESAVIKMLHLAGRESSNKLSLAQAMSGLNIVPVAISYEYDPCDVAKARELHAVATVGRFVKDENSDVQSILMGMIGKKGAVHVSYGTPLKVPTDAGAEQIAALIDDQIIRNYRLHPSNQFAAEQLQGGVVAGVGDTLTAEQREAKRKHFNQRISAAPVELQPMLLQMYANPVLNRQSLAG